MSNSCITSKIFYWPVFVLLNFAVLKWKLPYPYRISDCQQMSTATLLVHRSPFYWYSGKTRFWQKDLLWFLCKQIASFSLFIHRSVNKMRYQLYVYVIKDTLILWHKVSLFWQPWNGMNITTSSILNKLFKEVLSSW